MARLGYVLKNCDHVRHFFGGKDELARWVVSESVRTNGGMYGMETTDLLDGARVHCCFYKEASDDAQV